MRIQIKTQTAPSAIGPYSQAIQWGKLIFISGQIALRENINVVEGGIALQTHLALTNVKNILEAAGGSLKNVLKVTVFLTDINDFAIMNDVYSTYFGENPPARSAFQVVSLPKGAKIEIEAIATLD